jgi:hypothetical protein
MRKVPLHMDSLFVLLGPHTPRPSLKGFPGKFVAFVFDAVSHPTFFFLVFITLNNFFFFITLYHFQHRSLTLSQESVVLTLRILEDFPKDLFSEVGSLLRKNLGRRFFHLPPHNADFKDTSKIQGYLAHKKMPSTRTLQ